LAIKEVGTGTQIKYITKNIIERNSSAFGVSDTKTGIFKGEHVKDKKERGTIK
jgi:hypothetical protein